MLVEEESSIGMKFYAQNPPRMFIAAALPQTSSQGSQTDLDLDELLEQVQFYRSNLERVCSIYKHPVPKIKS